MNTPSDDEWILVDASDNDDSEWVNVAPGTGADGCHRDSVKVAPNVKSQLVMEVRTTMPRVNIASIAWMNNALPRAQLE